VKSSLEFQVPQNISILSHFVGHATKFSQGKHWIGKRMDPFGIFGTLLDDGWFLTLENGKAFERGSRLHGQFLDGCASKASDGESLDSGADDWM
jgi:hypothetical protein